MLKLHLQVRNATHAEVMQARLAIEPLMARLAAERKDRAGLDMLRDVLRDEGEVAVEDDPAFTRVSWDFHATVANLSGNRVLDLLAHSLQEIYESRVRASMTPVKERPGVHKTHLAIGEAILEGRGSDAERLMREHMLDFTKRVKRSYPGALESSVEWD
jgi:DNA-binding FadR family transcriptional regulator